MWYLLVLVLVFVALQGEVTSLQSERDGLLQKLSGVSTGSASGSSRAAAGGGGGGSGSRATAAGAGGGAALSRMKARVVELEARIKENRWLTGGWFGAEKQRRRLFVRVRLFALRCPCLQQSRWQCSCVLCVAKKNGLERYARCRQQC